MSRSRDFGRDSSFAQKTIAPAHLITFWRRLQILLESVDTSDAECLDSSSESENGSTPACGISIIDEILATSDAYNASSSQSPRDEQNITEMTKSFHSQSRLHRNTNIFECWDKQLQTVLKHVTNVILALTVTQPSAKKTV